MYLFKLTLKTVTDLEFANENALKHDILEKINRVFESNSSDTNAYIDEKNIKLALEGDDYSWRFRRKYRSLDDNTDEQLFLGRSRVVVKETEFGIEIKIAGNTYAKSLDCIHEFINRLNAGRIRLGDDTTLGKGLCVCRTLDTISLRFIRRLHDLHYTFDGQNECSGILISAHCDDGLFITNRAMFKGWNKSLNMIPASTWKGIFRNASNDWAEYMGEGTEIINRMFGNRSLGIKGCLIFYDSAISNPKTIFGVRTHINKFSASTIGDDLERFRIKEYVTGAFSIRIECTENIELYKKYIYTVLRDLHAGRINVGADKGIGKGYIKIDRVKEWNNVKKPVR